MGDEESIVIRKLHERINERLREMKIRDRAQAEPVLMQLIDEIEVEMSKDASLLSITEREAVYEELKQQEEDQDNSIKRVRTRVRQTFGKQLSSLDRLLAFAELEASRLERLICNGFDVLEAKTPRPDPLAVTGALLKCLLLLSLYSKMCRIAAEITCLMKESLLDGAGARLRTLHEHLIVATLISNDHTYELAERYQDHAVFEDLKRLRAIQRNVRNSVYVEDPEHERELSDRIAEAEPIARQAQARWGRALRSKTSGLVQDSPPVPAKSALSPLRTWKRLQNQKFCGQIILKVTTLFMPEPMLR
jgi:hypothetical protein